MVAKTEEDMIDEANILKELRAFTRHVNMMASQKERLSREHPNQWAALHDGDPIFADTLDQILEKVDEQGVPRPEVAIEFLDPDPKSFIL